MECWGTAETKRVEGVGFWGTAKTESEGVQCWGTAETKGVEGVKLLSQKPLSICFVFFDDIS